MADFSQSVNGGTPAGAPVPKLDRQIKPQKYGILHRSLGVSNLSVVPGARCDLSTGYPQLLWITFVEFGSFS